MDMEELGLGNESMIIEAPSLEEAYEKAMEAFNVNTIDLLDVKVLEVQNKVGLWGRGKVKISVSRKPEPSEPPEEADKFEGYEELVDEVLEFLKQLFEEMRAEVEVIFLKLNTSSDKKELVFDVRGRDSGMIIGKHGRGLNSLQHFLNIVFTRNKKDYRIVLDSMGYRKRREEGLRSLAIRTARRVKATGKPITLQPMLPFERRIIHLTLADDPDVTTYSIGENPLKRVVISPLINKENNFRFA